MVIQRGGAFGFGMWTEPGLQANWVYYAGPACVLGRHHFHHISFKKSDFESPKQPFVKQKNAKN